MRLTPFPFLGFPDGFQGGLSAENYISITHAPRTTVTRDLNDLVAKGALNKTGLEMGSNAQESNLVTGMKWLQSTFATRFSTSGMHAYRNHLALCEEGDTRKRDELLKRYCRGWFAGSAKAKKELAKDLAEESPEVDWETADLADLRELNEARWEIIAREEMKSAGKSESDVERDRKAAAWKVVIAKRLREETTAGIPWIAHRLRMGSPNDVCNLIHA